MLISRTALLFKCELSVLIVSNRYQVDTPSSLFIGISLMDTIALQVARLAMSQYKIHPVQSIECEEIAEQKALQAELSSLTINYEGLYDYE